MYFPRVGQAYIWQMNASHTKTLSSMYCIYFVHVYIDTFSIYIAGFTWRGCVINTAVECHCQAALHNIAVSVTIYCIAFGLSLSSERACPSLPRCLICLSYLTCPHRMSLISSAPFATTMLTSSCCASAWLAPPPSKTWQRSGFQRSAGTVRGRPWSWWAHSRTCGRMWRFWSSWPVTVRSLWTRWRPGAVRRRYTLCATWSVLPLPRRT